MVNLHGYRRYNNAAVVTYNSTGTSISLYPNPASDLLTISLFENLQDDSVSIINSTGKTVLGSTYRSGRKQNADIQACNPVLILYGSLTAQQYLP